jgi:hypothetical protein
MLSRSTLIAFIASVGLAAPAFAALDHWDRPSCYIYVHDQCFKNGENVCGDGYEWALDECDRYYPSLSGVVRPKPMGFKANTRFDPAVKAKITRSFAGMTARGH